jgi:hypothetical protein
MSKLFGQNGDFSASSVQEALSNIIKYASVLDQVQSANSGLAASPSFNDEQREEMIAQALLSQEGKVALGQAMANPIRKNLDYQGVARKALVVDPLPQGALPIYERDIDVAAVVVSGNGTAPESRVFGDRITVPTFEIVSNPTVLITEVRRRRFNVIDRAQQKAKQEIQAQEDVNVFQALDFASDTSKGGENTYQTLDTGSTVNELSKAGVLALKRQIDRWDLVTAKFFMNINEFTHMLNWESAGASGASQVDPVTQREILQTGLYGSIFAADIIVSKVVPVGQAFACAEPEFVGVMPVRQDIEVLPADEPKQRKLGWVVSEEIGVAIVNPRGVSSGYVTN